MNVNKKYDHDLVIENYYQQELEFQNDINKQQKGNDLAENITWSKTDKGIIITFPEAFEANLITGNVFLYRPSNKQFDFETPILLSEHTLLIPDERLLDGRWNIKVDWQYEGNSYMFKKEIVY
jgi:nitrogen fixation protein FixH